MRQAGSLDLDAKATELSEQMIQVWMRVYVCVYINIYTYMRQAGALDLDIFCMILTDAVYVREAQGSSCQQ
jgi:hypothetical protein